MSGLAPASGFTLIFIDPPYGEGFGVKAAVELDRLDLVNEDGQLILEDMTGSELPETIGRLCLNDTRHYGDTGFWFYARESRGEME